MLNLQNKLLIYTGYVPTGLPDFAVEECEVEAVEAEAEEFLSRNFLLMFTALNFFG